MTKTIEREDWLANTYKKLDHVLSEYDVSLRQLAQMSDVGQSWMVKFAQRAHDNPTITRVQRIHDVLDDILLGVE